MFEKQKQNLENQLSQIQNNMQMIDYKIRLYQKAVQLGSLQRANQDKELQKEKVKLFANEQIDN